MDHQGEIEKTKCRNWVRGVLAYKYLRCGIEGYADAIAQQEHKRILDVVKQNRRFQVCNKCDLRTLRPIHEFDPNKSKCPYQMDSCNCLKLKKETKKCRHNACDAILEEIIKSHASTPPAPNLKNTDIKKWCSAPWEVAKCFIAAPGYRKKTDASDIDIAGFLHVFINSIEFQNRITNVNIFKEVLVKRNRIFHSTTMELDDKEMSDCIDDIITILEDDKELKARNEAQQYVAKLRQLKQDNFIITTKTEEEAREEFLYSASQKVEEVKQVVRDVMSEIYSKVRDFDFKVHEANSDFDSTVHEANSDFDAKVHEIFSDFDSKVHEANSDFDSKLQDLNIDIDKAKSGIRDARSDIDCKINDAKAVARSISETFNAQHHKPCDRQTQELKQMVQDQRDLISQLHIVNQRLAEIEADVKRLDANVKRSCNVHLTHEKQKRVMQRMLVDLYQQHYVKTWVSPLKIQENDININDIYVWPDMVMEKKGNTHNECKNDAPNSETKKREAESVTSEDVNADKTRSHDSKSIEINRYHQVFQTNDVRHRKIYIVGDVGTGKSSFCKMMIYNWCRSFTDGDCNGAANLQTNDKSDDKTRKNPPISNDEATIRAANIKEMKQFEFLFFIRLPGMSGLQLNGAQVNDIFEMIKKQYISIALRFGDCLDRIFEEESERCLVIADGLDEWTPSKHTPGHVSFGIPVADRIQNATLVTLSRHSAKGMLNISFSEYDQKIKILGIKEGNLRRFVETYMSKLNKSKLVTSFLASVRLARLEHLEKTPFLLQQLIYTYCMSYSIGKSISDIYSQMVNVMFCWSRNRHDEEDITVARGYVLGEHKFELMQLPKLLGKYPNCKANKILLIILGKTAFDALSADIPTTMFGRLELQENGLSNAGISKLTKLGILSEYNSFDPQYEATRLSFLHISYLEFFAAVYISCLYSAIGTHTPVEREQSKSALEELFIKFESVTDILQLSQLLKMLCSLCPNLTVKISQLISNKMETDKILISYRANNHLSGLKPFQTLQELQYQVQTLIIDCVSQCGLDDLPAVSLSDILIHSDFNMSFLSKLKNSDVVSVKFAGQKHLAKISACIEKFPHLQYICIDARNYTITSQICELLCSSLQQAVCLKNITLSCHCMDSKHHFLDLSNHDQLQSIRLQIDLDKMKFLLNTKHLETLHIHDNRYTFAIYIPHEVISPPVWDDKFRQWHSYVPPKQKQIQIDYEKYDRFSTMVNSKSFEMNCLSKEINHGFCKRIASTVEQATSLKELSLCHGKCELKHCKSHSLDLSGHDQLQSLGLCSNFYVSGLNTTSLDSLFVGRFTDVNRILSLCSYSKLTFLCIQQSSTYTVEMNSAIHALGQLQRLSLRFVDIDDNALTVTPEMKNLSEIELDEVKIRPQAWHAFVESLLFPTQHIGVHASMFDVKKGEEEAFLKYVEHNKMFNVILRSYRTFRFRSKK